MQLFRTLALSAAALTFALGTAFAQTTPPATQPPAKPAAAPRAPAVKVTKVALKDLPAAVTGAVKTAYPKGTLTAATKTGADKDLLYSVSVKDGKATTMVRVSADGKIQTKK